MRRALFAALLATGLAGCTSAPRASPEQPEPPAAVLQAFAEATLAGRWEVAWPLLSARWRARTTPARLAEDWAASGPVGPEAATRVKALLDGGAGLAVGPREASLAVGQGRLARLVRESGAWRVEALE